MIISMTAVQVARQTRMSVLIQWMLFKDHREAAAHTYGVSDDDLLSAAEDEIDRRCDSELP